LGLGAPVPKCKALSDQRKDGQLLDSSMIRVFQKCAKIVPKLSITIMRNGNWTNKRRLDVL
jgi:hypothetical protein